MRIYCSERVCVAADDSEYGAWDEGEGELRSGEKDRGSVRGLQEVDAGDDIGEADFRDQGLGGAIAVLFVAQFAVLSRSYRGGLLGNLGALVL